MKNELFTDDAERRVIGHGRLLSVFHHILSQQNIFLENVSSTGASNIEKGRLELGNTCCARALYNNTFSGKY